MLKTPGNQKLVPDLGPQDRKAIHIEHAQLLRKHGALFTALYACYSFDQECVFKSVMEKHSTKRQLSTDEAVRDMEKLCMNSPLRENPREQAGSTQLQGPHQSGQFSPQRVLQEDPGVQNPALLRRRWHIPGRDVRQEDQADRP